MPLFVSEKDLIPGSAAVELHSGNMKTLFVYGNEANMMVATRYAGYHSKPHRHVPEQLNYVVEGELWIFIEEEGYLVKKNDFLRIPGNLLHWAWNRGSGPCTMVQVHAPVLAPESRVGTFGLFDEGETPNVRKSPPSESVDADVSAVERRVLAKHGITI
ncbi:cupin domain-containing protein [Aquabacter sp. CN5-332]|uniref:cupin domain-containing protein n=1 Tax=Aquabacter sp. CN5-332 TaxID=3156608 RepID=UPI0032B367E1